MLTATPTAPSRESHSFAPQPPSLRSRASVRASRLTLRQVSTRLPAGPLGVAIARRILATSMAVVGTTARGTTVTPVDSDTAAHGRVRGEWVHPVGHEGGAGVVLYLHGSGYALCSTRTHRPLISQLAAMTGLPVFSVSYRLAPSHVFPDAADDVERAYGWLLAQGYDAGRIVIAGDSAGGHLALDLTLELLRRGRELPAGLVMFSPLADPTFELCRAREQVRPDPMTSAESARRLVGHYVAGTDPLHPRLTHATTAGEVVPPTLIQAGGAEMLAGDAHHLARMLSETGTEVTLEVWPGQMHVFQAAHRVVPESLVALRRAARFVGMTLERRAAYAAPREVTA